MKRLDFELFILEKGLFFIKKFECIILFLFRYFCINYFLNVFKDISEILSFAELNNLLKFTNPFSGPASPTTIGNGNNLKSHFIP